MPVIYHKNVMYGGGSGGGGASAISDLTDVELTNLADGQILKYDATNQKWVNNNESGGTTVIANPSGTPTDELETIQIGEDIYEIVGGASGGNFEVTELWENTTGAGTGEQTLSSNIDDFDLLSIWCGVYAEYTGSPYIIQQCMISVSELNALYSSNRHFVFSGYDNRATYMDFYGNKVNVTNVYNNQRLLKVLGIKCGGSGGGAGYSKTALYTNPITSVGEVTLSDDISNYDSILFIVHGNSNGASIPVYVDTSYILSCAYSTNVNSDHILFSMWGTEYIRMTAGTANNKLNFFQFSAEKIVGIYGIKFGSGGGSESTSEIIPIESPTNTASRTFTFSKTPKKISMSYNTSDNWYFHWEFVWGDAFATFLAKPKTIGTGCTTGLSQITYGSDGKTFTITGSNAAQAANSTGGTGQIFVEY